MSQKWWKTLPELTFSRRYRALKNWFWRVLSHISEIDFSRICHLCLRNGRKTLPELTFSRGYRPLKNWFWRVLSHISEIKLSRICQSTWNSFRNLRNLRSLIDDLVLDLQELRISISKSGKWREKRYSSSLKVVKETVRKCLIPQKS